MQWLGLCALGIFIGFIITYGLVKITDWSKPGNVFSAIISAAIAGGVFTFIQYLGGHELGIALFLYPVGLAYGMLCANLRWITESQDHGLLKALHVIAFISATGLLLELFISSNFRALLP